MTAFDEINLSTACAALGIATREVIAIEEAHAALEKVTPRVIREQRRGATPLMALQRVHGWIASGWVP